MREWYYRFFRNLLVAALVVVFLLGTAVGAVSFWLWG